MKSRGSAGTPDAARASFAPHELQSAGSLLLVRPACFGFNAETASSNLFQHAGRADSTDAARLEFDVLVQALRAAGVHCCVVSDMAPPVRPDALFPNNWCSWHADGTLVLYPLLAPNRRLERREEIIEAACRETGFHIRRRMDLSSAERRGEFLEGTGSLVLDRRARLAYACRSPRTCEALVRRWCELMDYEPVIFDARDERGAAYYHTNVMLWIGSRCAMLCLEAIPPGQRHDVERRLCAAHELILIDRSAVAAFAGNMLEVRCREADARLLMSATAAAALSAAQRSALGRHYPGQIVADVPAIERVGGGSVRCMVAEIPGMARP